MSNNIKTLQGLSEQLVALALKAGATDAKASISMSSRQSVTVRGGKQEKFAANTPSASASLKVYVGQKVASSSTEDLSSAALAQLAADTVALAKVMPDNPDAVLANPADQLKNATAKARKLEQYDPTRVTLQQMLATAYDLERAARGVKGVTDIKGATVSNTRGAYAVAMSSGFTSAGRYSSFSSSVSALAQRGDEYNGGSSWHGAHYLADLIAAQTLGREAGEEAVASLGAGKAPSGSLPVVFSRDISGHALLGTFAEAIDGYNVSRGKSFLRDKLGTKVFADNVNVVDDPTIKREGASQVCDTDGLPSQRLALVTGGSLNSWLLDLASARRLGLASNGRASGGAPSPTNLYMEGGAQTVAQLVSGIQKGIVVKSLLGHDSAVMTGNFSRGAEGFLIENGKVTKPVKGFTVAGNLTDMFRKAQPANDLDLGRGYNCPSLLVDGMTVAS